MFKCKYSILVCTFLGIAMFSCSSTEQLAIGIVEPAPVQLSNEIKRIGVVKNIPATLKQDQWAEGLAGLVSKDDDYLIQKGVDAALDGLLKKLCRKV